NNRMVVDIMGYGRLENFVGNVLGTEGYHTVYEVSQTPSGTPGGDPNLAIYVLGHTAVLSGNTPGVPYDPRVVRTMLRWGNYDYATHQARWNASEVPGDNAVPPTRALPASLFLSAKPSFWGAMPWPPIGPDVMGGQDPSGHAYKIPAQ